MLHYPIPTKFKLQDHVYLNLDLTVKLVPALKVVNGKTGHIGTIFPGEDMITKENGEVISLGSTPCYLITLDEPVQINGVITREIPAAQLELELINLNTNIGVEK